MKNPKPRSCGALFLTPTFDGMKKFAIMGEGEAARLHANRIAEGATLVAICGSYEVAALAIEYSANVYHSIDDLLGQADAETVVICSSTGFHAEQIIKSLQAGKDVVVDGPLCLTKAAAWQIIETEKYCRRRLFLIQPSRFYSSFVKFKKQLDQQLYGRIYSFGLKSILHLPVAFFSGPEGRRFPGGGLLYGLFGPLMDLLVSIFGEIETVEAFLANDEQESEDEVERFGVAVLRMKSGVLGSLHWSCAGAVAGSPTTITIVADSGTVEAEFNNNELLLTKADNSVTAKAIADFNHGFYKTVYSDLFKALAGEEVNFPGSLNGAKTVEAIEKIYKAAR